MPRCFLTDRTWEKTIYLYQEVTVLYSESYIFNTISMFHQVISYLCSRKRTDYTVRNVVFKDNQIPKTAILIYQSYLYYQDSRQRWRHKQSTGNRKHWSANTSMWLFKILTKADQTGQASQCMRNEEDGHNLTLTFPCFTAWDTTSRLPVSSPRYAKGSNPSLLQ